MASAKQNPVIRKVLIEQNQGPQTRQNIFVQLQRELKRTVVSFFTSFTIPVLIEDADADMLEGILQKTDLSNGLALVISSPGGLGLSAERIINICRNYSGTGDYWVIVPSKAKSAATMICLGASRIIMGPTSELGPIGPQIAVTQDGKAQTFSLHNIVESYEDLFRRAIHEKGNLEPYLQQLERYDEREIKKFRSFIALSEDIVTRALASGMMKGIDKQEIKKKIAIFLKPEETKTHGRPIYAKEASMCGLQIELKNIKERFWELIYEL